MPKDIRSSEIKEIKGRLYHGKSSWNWLKNNKIKQKKEIIIILKKNFIFSIILKRVIEYIVIKNPVIVKKIPTNKDSGKMKFINKPIDEIKKYPKSNFS